VPPLDDIAVALERLETHIKAEKYSGYDPYDLLMSPLFRLPFLRSNKVVRLGAQQVWRRLPFNVRPILGIRKGYNPVTLGLCLYAYTSLIKVFPHRHGIYEQDMQWCVRELTRLRSSGYSGSSWGYDFDWEGRYAKVPAWMPTVVATAFITNALYRHFTMTGDRASAELCTQAAVFVTTDLRKTERDGMFCYSYSPSDAQMVLNATMKGARILAQASAITRDASIRGEAEAAMRLVVASQRSDGAWPYSVNDARTWVDNHHTGYILDCLDEVSALTGATWTREAIDRGVRYYCDHLFTPAGIPKYYDTSLFPIDTTAAAQSIMTLTRFRLMDRALQTARWTIATMQDRRGYFYYQKRGACINRTDYMRWSDAWMLMALAYFAENHG
jgi:hypothetical protein